MAIDRTAYNALVDDDGSNLVGTPWTKNIVKTVLLDPMDAAILDLNANTVTANSAHFTRLAMGAAPVAFQGAIAGPALFFMVARNVANNGDIGMIGVNNDDTVYVGDVAHPLVLRGSAITFPAGATPIFGGGITIGTVPITGAGGILAIGGAITTTGPITLANNQYLQSRNAGNTADVKLIGLDAGNVVNIAPSGAQETLFGFNIVILGNVKTIPTALMYWSSRSQLAAPGVAQLNLLSDAAANVGIGLDFNTDGVLKINNRAQAAGAEVRVGNLVSGTVGAATLTYGDVVVSRGGNPGTGYILFGGSANAHYFGYRGDVFICTDTIAPTAVGDLGTPVLPWRSAYFTASIGIGVNPSVGGVIRLPQTGYIYARNNANTGDIFVIGCGVGGDDVVYVGHPGSALNLRGTSMVVSGGVTVTPYLAVGVTPALSGTIRLPNNTGINFRNAANTADLSVVALVGNVAYIGADAATVQVPSLTTSTVTTSGDLFLVAAGAFAVVLQSNTRTLAFTAGAVLQPSTDNLFWLGDATHRFQQVWVGSSVNVGTNPATTGDVRLPNNGEGIAFRNAANTGNVYGLYSDSANNVVVGDSVTSGTRFPAASISLRTAGIVFIDAGARALAIGALPAQSGPLRLSYNSYITARESTNTADRRLIGFYQNVDLDADASGVSFHGGRSLLICPADGTFELHNRGGNLWATLLAGQIIAKTGSLVVGSSPGIQEFGTNSIALGGATTIACVQSSFDPVTSNLANGMWWVEATGVSPARQLRLAVRDGGVTYYQNIGAAH